MIETSAAVLFKGKFCCCIIQREIVATPAGHSTRNRKNNTVKGVNIEIPTDIYILVTLYLLTNHEFSQQ